jgi:DNA-binding SARP family transcriptional activator
VLPYSEALAEAAMEVAAASGDAAELRRAFDDLGRVVEELEPGGWPTGGAEERYRQLRAEIKDQASLAAIDAAPRSTRPSAPAAL